MSFFDITPERPPPRWDRAGHPTWPQPDGVTVHYPEQALRLGIRYADGRAARSRSDQPLPVDDTGGEDPEDLVLTETGTGGTGRQWNGRFWVHPLPPAGPVTFVASWLLWGGDRGQRSSGQLGDPRGGRALGDLVARRVRARR